MTYAHHTPMDRYIYLRYSHIHIKIYQDVPSFRTTHSNLHWEHLHCFAHCLCFLSSGDLCNKHYKTLGTRKTDMK